MTEKIQSKSREINCLFYLSNDFAYIGIHLNDGIEEMMNEDRHVIVDV